jgi:hypothetical protein
VRTITNLCLAMVALSLLPIPAMGQNRSNKGGAEHGDTDQVQAGNKKQDKDRDPSPGNDKNKGKH